MFPTKTRFKPSYLNNGLVSKFGGRILKKKNFCNITQLTNLRKDQFI